VECRTRTLAGLVSDEAEDLFVRLSVAGSQRSAVTADQATVGELVELGLATPTGDSVRLVDQATALQMLMERRQAEVIDAQRRILDGMARLSTLLPLADDGRRIRSEGIETLIGFDAVNASVAQLYPSTREHMRGTEPGEFPAQPGHARLRTPPASALASGARFQMIYQASYSGTAVDSGVIDKSVTVGEQVRLRTLVPIKMLHVDNSVALVSTDRSAHSALLIRTRGIVAMLAEWFDVMWTASTTLTPYDHKDGVLSSVQQQILRLMPVDPDESIARRLKLSVTTVRRHVKAIYTALGVDNRFAAGVAAAKRGWI
jgi:DNA-binding CsgD family transcriptional regulator